MMSIVAIGLLVGVAGLAWLWLCVWRMVCRFMQPHRILQAVEDSEWKRFY